MDDIKNIDSIFSKRTCYKFTTTKVDIELLKEVYSIAKLGSTSFNCCPLRIKLVISDDSRKRLINCVNKGNIDKVLSAPVTAIFAYDTAFYNSLHKLHPNPGSSFNFFSSNPAAAL